MELPHADKKIYYKVRKLHSVFSRSEQGSISKSEKNFFSFTSINIFMDGHPTVVARLFLPHFCADRVIAGLRTQGNGKISHVTFLIWPELLTFLLLAYPSILSILQEPDKMAHSQILLDDT